MTQETHDLPDAAKLMQLVFGGYVQSQVIYVAVRLGIADALADGPKDAGALATATKAHAPTLRRLMRVLTALGLSDEGADGRYSLTPQGGCCARTSHTAPGTLGAQFGHSRGSRRYPDRPEVPVPLSSRGCGACHEICVHLVSGGRRQRAHDPGLSYCLQTRKFA